MRMKAFARTGRKVLASALSAAMVVAFTPAVALGSVQSTDTIEDSNATWDNSSAFAAGYCFEVKDSSGVTTYYAPSELKGITTQNATITLIDDITISSTSDLITVPKGATLDLNYNSIKGQGLGGSPLVTALDGSSIIDGSLESADTATGEGAQTSSALEIAGSVTISDVTASSISSQGDATLNTTGYLTVKGPVAANVCLGDKADLNARVLYGNATLGSEAHLYIDNYDGEPYAVGVKGNVAMGPKSTLHISRQSSFQYASVIGLDGDLAMGEGAAGAQANISVFDASDACAINNSAPITVCSGQILKAWAYETDRGGASQPVIAGDLTVEEGADVEVRCSDWEDEPSKVAIAGKLVASVGTYVGKIAGAESTVTGGSYSADPSAILAEGYGTKYTRENDFWGYHVVPRSKLSTEITNAYWGIPSYNSDPDAGKYHPPYAVNFTGGLNSKGIFNIEILKQQEDGAFASIYDIRYHMNRGGVRDHSLDVPFHEALERLGDGEKSGVYKFHVAEWDEEKQEQIGQGAESQTYTYRAAEQVLGSATNLHWDASKPTVAKFTLPKGATGYVVYLYLLDAETGTYRTAGWTSYVGTMSSVSDGTMEEWVDFGDNHFTMLTKNGTYAFSVRPLSFDLNTYLDGKEGEKGPELTLGTVIKPVIDAIAEELKSETGNNGKNALTSADSNTVGTAMIADDAARETIADAESKYAAANNVSVVTESTNPDIAGSDISVVGAAFNASADGPGTQGETAVALKVSKVEEKRVVNDPSLESVIQFSMDLVETKAGGTPVELGKTGDLDVPVCVTIPVPAGYQNLRIWHYHNGSTVPDVIWPVIFEEGGKTFARFYVTSFSDFVLVAENNENGGEGEGTDPSPGNPGGGSGPIGGSSDDSTITSHTHVFGAWTVTTPATTEAEGVESRVCSSCGEVETRSIAKLPGSTAGQADQVKVGTTVTVSGITYKVTAKGEAKVTKVSTSKKTATLPATVKIKGKTYKVVGISASALKGSKATTLVIKTKLLTKKGVKDALKGSKVETVKVSVSSKKSTNKSYVTKYIKYFTKANCGKKVAVK